MYRNSAVIIFFLLFFQVNYSQEIHWAKKIINCSEDFEVSGPFSPNQILGKYSVMPYFGKSNNAWSLLPGLKKNQYITLQFDSVFSANQLVIAENYNPGAISKITLSSTNSEKNVIFENVNPTQSTSDGRFWNLLNGIEKFPIFQIRIDFNTTNYYDEYQIDAVGLTNTKDSVRAEINFSKSAEFKFQPENLKNINSDYSELAPIISSDGKTLYFTREGFPENIGEEKQQDVWYSTSKDGIEFDIPKNIGPPINDQYNNFAISVTPDNNTLVLGNVYRKNLPPLPGLSFSHFNGSSWSFPEKINISGIRTKSKQNSYSLGNDGKTLLLSIVGEDTYGEHDLYVSFLQEDSSWSKPMNLGAEINTASNEESPFLASDGITLYFSGNGYPGLGNNDIFMTRRLDDTWEHWSEPINLGNKINSIYWDAYFSVTASGNYAYFVSSTQAPFSEDIYRIELPKEVKPTSVVLISGKVLNKQNNRPVQAKIIYEELSSGKEIGFARSNDSTGNFQITLPAGKKYGFLAVADGFIAINENLDLTQLHDYREIDQDLFLVPIEKGEKIKLNNIFFETGKYEILPESFSELNRIIKLLSENPKMKIKIEGHTDNVGNDKDNQLLSENRAKAIADYLGQKINKDRFTWIGFGKRKPVAKNDIEEGRKLNRRVEFVITEK